jgi:phosphoglycerate kinase
MVNFNQELASLTEKDTVLLRVDFNLPRDKAGNLVVGDRLTTMLPVIKQLLAKRCAVLIVSHMGRPREGVVESQYSLADLAPVLSKQLAQPVSFLSSWPYQRTYLAPATVALAENTRFLAGESSNDTVLAHRMLEGVTAVVMEAFACSHRSHASTVGIATYASRVILGPEHISEVMAIERFKQYKDRAVAVVGGKKIVTKMSLIQQMVAKMDYLCVGGGVANTLLHALGYNLGNSFVEFSQLEAAKSLYDQAMQEGVEIVLPEDVVVCESFEDANSVRTVAIADIAPHEKVVDVGPDTVQRFKEKLNHAQSAYWNGPLGVYEYEHGVTASAEWAHALAEFSGYSLVGGGDTLSVLQKLGVRDFSHISMGGGAFLYYLAHGSSPVLSLLKTREEEAVHA